MQIQDTKISNLFKEKKRTNQAQNKLSFGRALRGNVSL